jgi:hypothetical protein
VSHQSTVRDALVGHGSFRQFTTAFDIFQQPSTCNNHLQHISTNSDWLQCLFLVESALVAQTVDGTVISTSGAALAGVGVTLMKGNSGNEVTAYSTTTDASGAFRLQDVKDGVYVVRLQLAGFLSPNPGGPGNRPFADRSQEGVNTGCSTACR